jgi:hypothetical protein
VRPAVVPTYFRSSGSMPLIGFRLRLLRTLATIQHNFTITDSCKHFLDDNLLFDHIITILQNFSSEFLKLSGSRVLPLLELPKALRFRLPTKSQLNNQTHSTHHNNNALFRAHITLQTTPEHDQSPLASFPGCFCVSFHHWVVLPVTFFLRLFPSAPASREVTLA